MATRRSWGILATLAVVAVSAAAGVVTWDARVRPSTAEPVPAWSATLSSPANPVSSAAQVGSAAIQPGPPLAPSLQLAGARSTSGTAAGSGPWTRAAARSGGGSRPVPTDQAARRW